MKQQIESNTLNSILEASGLPEEGQNLRRKIDSIIRTIENLQAKKVNLEFEIKTQKRVLNRKRLELKRVHKSQTSKLKVTLEEEFLDLTCGEDPAIVEKIDQALLRESAKILEE